MTESTTKTELLTDQQIAEIETLRKRNTGLSFGYTHELCTAIDSLIATVKQLRTALSNADRVVVEAVKVNGDLQSQLEQLRAENEQLKLIVDVGTNDDPGTALAKLRKIQHVAATAMRDECVEAVKTKGGHVPFEELISLLESLTLDPLEPEKQK